MIFQFPAYLINYSCLWCQNIPKISKIISDATLSLHTKFEVPITFPSMIFQFSSYLINYSWKWRHHEPCAQKKCVCHGPYNIVNTLRQKVAKKILCWKFARGVLLIGTCPLHYEQRLTSDSLATHFVGFHTTFQRTMFITGHCSRKKPTNLY